MTIVKFEDIIKEGTHAGVTTEHVPSENGIAQAYQTEDISSTNVLEAEREYLEELKHRKAMQILMEPLLKRCEKAKNKLLEAVGYKVYKSSKLSTQRRDRKGSINEKALEMMHPSVKVKDFREEGTFYWVIIPQKEGVSND